jgi:hypothetical protein
MRGSRKVLTLILAIFLMDSVQSIKQSLASHTN